MVEFDDNLNPLEPQPAQAPQTPTPPPAAMPSPNSIAGMPMRRGGMVTSFLLGFILLALVVGIGFYIAHIGSNNSTPPNIGQSEGLTVSGEATVYATPDLAKVSIGVEKTGKTVSAVQDDLATTTTNVTAAIKALGITDDNIKTSDLNITPQYSSNGRTIISYVGDHTLTISLQDLTKVDDVTTAAVAAGATSIQNVSFTVSDPEKWWQDARTQALAQAKTKADQIAKATGVRLGKILSINEWGNQPWDNGGIAYGVGGNASSDIALPVPTKGVSPDIQPGNLELQVNVSLVYRIN